MIKYLVLGSGPYVTEWYNKHGKEYLKAGYRLVAINNAWYVDPKNLFMWCHSSDYFEIGRLRDKAKAPGFKDLLKEPERRGMMNPPVKYSYVPEGSGTMILNVLNDLLNQAVYDKEIIEVALAGCNCVYDGAGTTHFYGDSTKDAIRFGEEYIVRELKRLGEFYAKEGFKIYNVSERQKTLLPYERFALCATP